jgi:hypothetical protein
VLFRDDAKWGSGEWGVGGGRDQRSEESEIRDRQRSEIKRSEIRK